MDAPDVEEVLVGPRVDVFGHGPEVVRTGPRPTAPVSLGRVPRRIRLDAAVLASAAAAPFVLLVAGILRFVWFPPGDHAVIAARTADVFGGDLPLLGAYSRFPFTHPGPLEYYVMALPFTLSGRDARALLVTTVLVHLLCVIVAVALLSRAGGWPAMLLGALVVAVLFHSFGPTVVMDPWNPYAPLFPFLLFVVSVWAALCAVRWALPVAVAAGSYAVGCHVGFAVPVGGLVAFAALYTLVITVRSRRRYPVSAQDSGWRRVAAISGVVALASWSPALWDQLVGTHNLSKLWDFFTGPGTTTIGVGRALGIAGPEFSPVGPWLSGGPEPLSFFGTVEPGQSVWVPVVLVALGALTVRRHRERGTDPLVVFGVVTFVSTLLAVYAVARVSGPVLTYFVRWTWVVAALAWGCVGCHLFEFVVVRRPRWMPAVQRGGGAVAFTIAVLASVAAVHARPPLTDASDAVAAVTPAVLAAVPVGTPVTIDHVSGSADDGSVVEGLQWQLERRGRHVAFEPGPLTDRWGPARAGRAVDGGTVHLVVIGTDLALEPTLPGGWTRIAFHDARTPRERVDAQALLAAHKAQIDRQWEALTRNEPLPDVGMDRATIERFLELRQRIVVGVFRRSG